MTMSIASNWRLGIVSILFLTLGLSGCASKYGPQTTPVNYYPQCYQPIADLRADESNTTKTTAGGAVAGALLGALIGGLATGKAEGALIGAAAGGATGAIAGHAYGTSQSKARDNEMMRAYLLQLDGEATSMDRATAAAKVSCQCYDRQFTQAVAEVRAGRMTKLELTKRYEEIRAGLEETSRILQSAGQNMAQKDSEYQQILAEERQIAQAPAQTSAASSRQRRARLQAVSAGTDRWQQARAELAQQQRATEKQSTEYQQVLDALDV